MKKLIAVPMIAAMAIAGYSATASAGATLDAAKKRGKIICGVNGNRSGFSALDSKGQWTGMDVDTCKAIAAAVLGDSSKVQFVKTTSLNEFVAYGTLGTYIQAEVLSERAVLISTYALCGFANFSSIGIQIGGISALAPGRRADLAKVGLKAMFGGALASWTTATIAGILL